MATGISRIVGLLVISTHFLFKKGDLIIGKYKPQFKLYRKIIFKGLPEAIAQYFLCKLFGADAATLDFTAVHIWEYCWGFIVGSINTLLSAYLYSTKRSGQTITLNIIRGFVRNTLIIMLLPKLFGNAIVWHTFGIYEVLVLIVAFILKKSSERNGIVY